MAQGKSSAYFHINNFPFILEKKGAAVAAAAAATATAAANTVSAVAAHLQFANETSSRSGIF
ncbi:hypothetical protein GQX74_007952 [Glossina fuscipes]|nr:hypothetical protein GQX74_007952 [Glossina fuscipes]